MSAGGRGVFWLRFAGALLGVGALVAGLVLLAPKLLPGLETHRFRSERFEFAVPRGWTCALEGTEWVCSLAEARGPQDALVILAEKLRGPQDSLAAYEAHLRQPTRRPLGEDEEETVSDVRFVRRSRYRNHEWVDSLHYQSELPHYLTRYLATTTSGSAILLTFSAHEDAYDRYVDDMEDVVESLRVYQARE